MIIEGFKGEDDGDDENENDDSKHFCKKYSY